MICLFVIGVLLFPAATPSAEDTEEHVISIEELPGGAVSPGGASSFQFEYELHGERVLFREWTGPNDIRVMSEDLSTLHVIVLPSESFEVSDARWSHGGSIIVLGTNGTGGDDTLLVYKAPLYEHNSSSLPRETIPLATIDAVALLAGDNILAIAGRDFNGTSFVLILEMGSKRILEEHKVYDNLTVQAFGNIETNLYAVDVMGGSSIFNTSQWNYEERVGPIVGPCQFSVLRTNLPWTSGGVNGRLVVREFLLLNKTVTYDVDIPPVQASTYIRNDFTSNVIVASPNGKGGSKIQVLHDYNGSFELGAEIDTDMTVTSMMLTPGESSVFGVGFSNGVFKMYNVSDYTLVDIEEPFPGPDQDPGPGPDGIPGLMDDPNRNKDMMYLSYGIVIVLIVVISLWWVVKVKNPKMRS